MNKTVVIITPELYYKSVSDGFNLLGWNTIPLLYGIIDQKSLLDKIFWKINPKKQHLISFNKKIEESLPLIIKKKKPDFILVVKGNKLSDKSEQIIKSIKEPIALWTIDSVTRIKEQADFIKYAKNIFFQDGADQSLVSNSDWLPFGYDDKVFYPKYLTKKYDILFIGYLKLPFYQTRLNYLNMLIESGLSANYKIAFAGTTGDNHNDKLLSEKLSINKIDFLGKKPLEEYANLVQNSKICINIHQNDGGKPINPMFFAIGACKTCQVAEDKDYLNNWLIHNIDYCAVNENNFIAQIKSLLSNDDIMFKYIENSYLKVTERDSFRGRATFILTKMGFNNIK